MHMSPSHSLVHQKERDGQKQIIAAKSHHIQEMQDKLMSMTEELKRKQQMLLSVQEVGV